MPTGRSIMTEGRALDRGGVGETIPGDEPDRTDRSGAAAADGSIKATP